MTFLEQLEFYEDVVVLESKYQQLQELFGKSKHKSAGIPVQQIISKILHYSMIAVKEMLDAIDFTKDYTDKEIDTILIALKNKFDELDKKSNEDKSRSLDDILRDKNFNKIKQSGQKFKPVYLGI